MRQVLSALAVAGAVVIAAAAQAAPTTVFINEIHYDNTSTDTGEAIEIAGPAGTDLTGWSVVLYNGATGATYNTTALSGVIPNQQNGFGTVVLNYPSNGIQNGSPDGIALVDSANGVVQFLSYEGSFIAVGGPANGMISVDIGVAEGSSTPVGDSLQLAGVGSLYSDFSWQPASASTFGAVNGGQTFLAALASPLINEVLASHAGTDDTEFIELYGTPGSILAGLSLIVVEGDAIGSQGAIDRRIDFGPGDIIGANSFFLIGNPLGLGTNYGVVPNLAIFTNFLENSSLTLALVQTSSITGTSVTGLEVVIDAVALTDGDAGDLPFLGAPELGPDGPFFPAGARRIVDGFDTDTAADWVLADFNLGPDNTPTAGTIEAVPEPGTLALLGLGLAGLAAARRRKR